MASDFLNDADHTPVADVTFPKATSTQTVTDGYYKVTVNRTDYYITSTQNINVGGRGYALVDGVMMACTDVENGALSATKDMVITTDYFLLTAPSLTDMGTGATATWGGDVVEYNGSYYAQNGKTVTLTIKTGEITRASDPKLTIGGTGVSLAGFNGITSNMGGTAPSGSGNVITFSTGETYSAGTINISVSMGTSDVTVTLAWGA